MTIEVLGMVSTSHGSESIGWQGGPVVDVDYLTRFAQAHDRSGFDRILVAHGASSPDGFAVAAHVLYNTERAGVLIAHRPGFVTPTQAARKLATLEHLTGAGRVAIHHITGGSDGDQRRDGDWEDHDTRYLRTAEFIQVLRQTLTADAPFDHTGRFYRYEQAFSTVKPATDQGIPIFFGGQSEAAVQVGAEHADVYMLFGEPLAQTAERIDLLRSEAAKFGRTLSFSLSTRPIVADTEDAAWAKAEAIREATAKRLAAAEGLYGKNNRFIAGQSNSVGDRRLRETAARQEVHDERLWFGITALTGQGGNSSAHVGTPAQVADALAQYHAIGVDRFLIRGFEPLEDVELWGRGLVPELRARLEQSAPAEPAPAAELVTAAAGVTA
jgi:alkanesulfonate monooxygenase